MLRNITLIFFILMSVVDVGANNNKLTNISRYANLTTLGLSLTRELTLLKKNTTKENRDPLYLKNYNMKCL